jgi:cytidylate kinase
MKSYTSIDYFNTYMNAQIQLHPKEGEEAGGPVVTISRQSGAGCFTVCEKLVEYLTSRSKNKQRHWLVYNKNLAEKVVNTHHLPQRIAKFMPEARASVIKSTIGELLGLHPASWTLVEKTAETILQLAHLGNVIIVGRGANIITAKLDHTFHVRLVGSIEKRLAHLMSYYKLSRSQAGERMKTSDKDRKNYIKEYFDKNIDDPLLYHLIINTDVVSSDEAAAIIGEAVLRRSPKPA